MYSWLFFLRGSLRHSIHTAVCGAIWCVVIAYFESYQVVELIVCEGGVIIRRCTFLVRLVLASDIPVVGAVITQPEW